MKVLDALMVGGELSVLADEHNGEVRLWTLTSGFCDKRAFNSLKRFFPNLNVEGRIIKLGGYKSLVEAQHKLANAKVYSHSKNVQSLFRHDFPESAATLKHYS
jgi:hypothetical protein